MNKQPTLTFIPDENRVDVCGEWKTTTVESAALTFPTIPEGSEISLNASDVEGMDTAGAFIIDQWLRKLSDRNVHVKWLGLTPTQKRLLTLVATQAEKMSHLPPLPGLPSWMYRIGQQAIVKYIQMLEFLAFIGELVVDFTRTIRKPKRLQINSLVASIEEIGYRALPINALLAFLIGVVLAFQMGRELEAYGANIFIVNVTGLAILREFAPLIVAIIGAGRTSSALTASIGTMKVKEEIDAILAMGLSPMNRLVVPRFIALLIVMPLLTLWAAVFGIMGSMMMSSLSLNVGYYDFIIRFEEVIHAKEMWVGLSKAPAFALIIASVGCFQGFQVKLSAESIGHLTTKSVVQSIFLIIIADALYSVVYSIFGI